MPFEALLSSFLYKRELFIWRIVHFFGLLFRL